jgi:ribonuclease P protein component
VSSVSSEGDSLSGARRNEKVNTKFPRSMRLLRHTDFERVYKQGRRHFSPHLTVFYLPKPEGNSLRVGFTVGRVLGGAVERNRIKRRLREAVRQRTVSPSAAVDVVINPKKSVLNMNFAILQREVAEAFAVIEQKLAAKAQ